MNIQNMTRPTSPTLSADDQKIFDIWIDCGLNEVLRDTSSIRPIAFFLEHLPDELADISMHDNLERISSQVLRKFMEWQSRINLPNHVERSLLWMYRNTDPAVTQRVLKAALLGDRQAVSHDVEYGQQHPSFAEDKAKWQKFTMLLALNNFPAPLNKMHLHSTQWLTHHECLVARHGEHPLLKKMLRSIQRNELQHHRYANSGGKSHPLFYELGNPVYKKYFATKSMERLRMMRFYYYEMSAQ
jgi:hypothetical protein